MTLKRPPRVHSADEALLVGEVQLRLAVGREVQVDDPQRVDKVLAPMRPEAEPLFPDSLGLGHARIDGVS